MVNDLRIGAILFAVQTVPSLTAEDDGTHVWGECRHDTQTITIEGNIGTDVQRITLLHEIMHELLNQAGVEEQDETTLNILASGLLSVFYHNPDLIQELKMHG